MIETITFNPYRARHDNLGLDLMTSPLFRGMWTHIGTWLVYIPEKKQSKEKSKFNENEEKNFYDREDSIPRGGKIYGAFGLGPNFFE